MPAGVTTEANLKAALGRLGGAVKGVRQRVDALETVADLRPESFGVLTNGALAGGTIAANAVAWAALFAEAHSSRKRIYLSAGARYNIAGARVVNQTITDIYGPGQLVAHASGDAKLQVIHEQQHRVSVSASPALVTLPGTGSDRETMSVISVPMADLSKFRTDHVWRISSADKYGWAGGDGVWKAEIFSVLGILYNVTSSTIRENDTVIGVGSGASGVVQSIDGTGNIVLKWQTGTFAAGEGLTVGGVAKGTLNGSGRVLVHGVLDDTYTTTIQVRKMRTDLEFNFHATINTTPEGDDNAGPDSIVGEPNRPNFLLIAGVINGIVEPKVFHAWATAVYAASCYRMTGKIYSRRSGHNASTNSTSAAMEGAYGYSFESKGSTAHSSIEIDAVGLRHGYTTNVRNYPERPIAGANGRTEFDELETGTTRRCEISGAARHCHAAGFDNHVGAEFLTYRRCLVVSSESGKQYYGGVACYQNRSYNTRYIECEAVGGQTSFLEMSANDVLEAGKVSVIEFIRCIGTDAIYAGIRSSATAESANHKLVTRHNIMRGTSKTSGQTTYSYVAYKIAGVDWDSLGDTAGRFSGAPIEMVEAAAFTTRTTLVGFTVDMTENSSGAVSGVTVSGVQDVYVKGLTFLASKTVTWSSNRGAFRVRGSGTTVVPSLYFDGDPQIIGDANTLPRISSSSTATPIQARTPNSPPVVTEGGTAPAQPLTDDLWADTFTSPAAWKRWTGTAWAAFSSGSGTVGPHEHAAADITSGVFDPARVGLSTNGALLQRTGDALAEKAMAVAATGGAVVVRDGNGRTKIADASADDDAATLSQVKGRARAVTTDAGLWIGTQAEYDAITTKDPKVLYAVTT